MTYLDISKKQLTIDEGKRNKLYRCSANKLTIGVGHNIEDNGLSDEAIDFILTEDIRQAEKDCRKVFPNFDSLNDVRKAVIINMMFNLGYAKFATFRRTIAAIQNGGYTLASQYMLDSLWAKQVGERAERLAKQMLTGEE